MKNLKIGKRIYLTFAVVLALLFTISAVAVISLSSNAKKFKDFYEVGHQITLRTVDMRRNIQSAAKNVGYATMTLDAAATNSYIDGAETNMSNLKDEVKWLRSNFRGDKSLIDQVEQAINNSESVKNQVFELARANESQQAADLYFQSYNPYLLEIQETLVKISDDATANADADFSRAQSAAQATIVMVLLLAVFTLLGTLLIAGYMAQSIVKPVKELEHAAKEMSLGSLKVDMKYQSKDELGGLAESMRTTISGISNIVEDIGYLLGEMADGNFCVKTKFEESYVRDYRPILDAMRKINTGLSDAMSQINQASDQVSSGSDQVSSGAQALSQGATEQASSIEELAATINDISEQVNKNAENAKSARDLSSQAANNVEISNEKMMEMSHAMSNISDKSSQIGRIIKTIEDIAFQTNILALNAAVEAARAGEAGKGFAVVADEVRSLASKSGEAASDTTKLIEESIKAVEDGTRIADETAMAMLTVVDSAKQIEDIIVNISHASETQASSISQITQGIDQISSVVQTNSATAEESAAASEELSGQAQMLKSLVGRFRLKGSSPNPVVAQKAYSAPESVSRHSEPLDKY